MDSENPTEREIQAVELLRKGALTRRPGGYWAPSGEDPYLIEKGKWVGTRTINRLVGRGVALVRWGNKATLLEDPGW